MDIAAIKKARREKAIRNTNSEAGRVDNERLACGECKSDDDVLLITLPAYCFPFGLAVVGCIVSFAVQGITVRTALTLLGAILMLIPAWNIKRSRGFQVFVLIVLILYACAGLTALFSPLSWWQVHPATTLGNDGAIMHGIAKGACSFMNGMIVAIKVALGIGGIVSGECALVLIKYISGQHAGKVSG